jgi:SAM-dependent methyltransferase
MRARVSEPVDRIRQYWDERAATNADAATTNDLGLRRLESATLMAELARIEVGAGSRILDVGCGDGATTLSLAKRYPQAEVRGVDFSPQMIALARSRAGASNVSFAEGDVRRLRDAVGGARFDLIVTNRCLINLNTAEEQYAGLAEIAASLVPGGWFIGTENFTGGQETLNATRRSAGLGEIPVRWHNLFFDEGEFRERAGRLFDSVEVIAFSSTYYLVTRVVYSALCRNDGVEPDYAHPIHDIAAGLPAVGDFSPIKLIRARVRNADR